MTYCAHQSVINFETKRSTVEVVVEGEVCLCSVSSSCWCFKPWMGRMIHSHNIHNGTAIISEYKSVKCVRITSSGDKSVITSYLTN